MNWIDMLDALAAHDCEDAAGRANLAGTGLLALRELGAGDARLQAFASAWSGRLAPAPLPAAWPVGDAWPGRFGQRRAWPAYRALFAEWIEQEGATDMLAQVLPQLWPGCGAAGLQALVRTASAVRTGHRQQVADALAHWASRWMPLPLPDAAGELAATKPRRATAPTDDPVALLRTLSATASTARRLEQRMAQAARDGVVARAAARLVIDERTPARLAATAAVACAGSGDPVARLLVVATHAVRVLARFGEEPAYAWRAYAAAFMHAAVAAGWRVQAPTPLRPWGELVAAAIALDDPLTIACVESCRAEEQAYATPGQTLWQAAAAQALAAAAAGAQRPAQVRR